MRTPHVPFLFAACLLAAAPAAQGSPPAPSFAPAARSHVLFDTAPDGALWAKGRSYKMCFAAGGAAFVPVLGPRAAHNFPLRLRLAQVTADGVALPLAVAQSPERSGDEVRFDHGAVREVWRLGLDAAEQDFVLADGTRGEVVLRLAVEASPSPAVPHRDGGLWFAAADLGGVHYGDAVVVDGAGQRLARPVSWQDGAIEIRVPAAFLAAARGPVTIDPVVRTITVDGSPRIQEEVDCAWSPRSAVWLVVYHEVISANDHDVISRRYDRTGGFLGEVAVDISGDDTLFPAVACHRNADQFLVVWSEVGTLTTRVRARTRQASGDTQGAAMTVRLGGPPLAPGSVFFPDVGGPAHSGGNEYFVVWQQFLFVGSGIEGCTVSAGGQVGPVVAVSSSAAFEANAAISQSSGRGGAWMVVYESSPPVGGQKDIACSVVGGDGTVQVADVAVTNSRAEDTDPDVAGDGTDFLIVWQSDAGSPRVFGRRFRFAGTLVSRTGAIDLTAAEPRSGPVRPQRRPRVASHGCRWTYAYQEDDGSGAHVFAAVVVGDGALGFVEGHTQLSTGTPPFSTGGIAAIDDGPNTPPAHALVGFSSGDAFATLFDPLHAGGGFAVVQTGCGVGREEPNLTATGQPVLGASFTINLFAGSEIPLILVGPPSPPLPLCAAGCALGVFPIVVSIPAATATFAVPCAPELVQGTIAFQGVQIVTTFGATTLCGPPQYGIRFRTSDTLLATLR